jgi:hypothetical protein
MKRTALLAVLMLAGVAHAATTEFILFKEPNFRGESDTIKGEVAQLTGGFARNGSSMVVRGGFWEVCTDDHFRGECHVVAPGEYGRLGELSNRIVSVRFLSRDAPPRARDLWAYREGWDRDERRERRLARRDYGSVELFGQRDFGGRSIRVEENVANFQGSRWDGRASSVVVNEGVWQLCSEPRFEGMCATLGPGRYDHLAQLNNRVSSLRQVR